MSGCLAPGCTFLDITTWFHLIVLFEVCEKRTTSLFLRKAHHLTRNRQKHPWAHFSESSPEMNARTALKPYCAKRCILFVWAILLYQMKLKMRSNLRYRLDSRGPRYARYRLVSVVKAWWITSAWDISWETPQRCLKVRSTLFWPRESKVHSLVKIIRLLWLRSWNDVHQNHRKKNAYNKIVCMSRKNWTKFSLCPEKYIGLEKLLPLLPGHSPSRFWGPLYWFKTVLCVRQCEKLFKSTTCVMKCPKLVTSVSWNFSILVFILYLPEAVDCDMPVREPGS